MYSVDIIDRDSLLEVVNNGGTPKYLFFWGHQPRGNAEVGKECLSQWWSAEFRVDGERYASAEHYMMAEKARLFGDEETRRRIVRAGNPGAAKRFGREVRDFDEVVWEGARFEIVVRGNVAKFSQNGALKEFLLSTGDRVLVEASPLDRIWGIGLAGDDPNASNPEEWPGLNLLGFALMETRRRLRAE